MENVGVILKQFVIKAYLTRLKVPLSVEDDWHFVGSSGRSREGLNSYCGSPFPEPPEAIAGFSLLALVLTLSGVWSLPCISLSNLMSTCVVASHKKTDSITEAGFFTDTSVLSYSQHFTLSTLYAISGRSSCFIFCGGIMFETFLSIWHRTYRCSRHF